MLDRLVGDRIRLESRSSDHLLALTGAAAPAFARAAGGEPGEWEDQDAVGRGALESCVERGAAALVLTLRAQGVEIRPAEEPGADLLLVWTA